jgi:hypothetical protein
MPRRLALAAALAVMLPGAALGKTYNSPFVNGHVTVAASDWDADELGVADPPGDCRYVPSDGDLVNLYVTWDADSLYVGVTTTNGPGSFGNGYLLFIDKDAQSGITGATDFTSANFYPRKVRFTTMGADVVMGGWNLPVTFEVKNCTNPAQTTPFAEAYTQCNPGWQHVEVRLSWNGLFGLGQGVVPAGTTLRFIAAVVGGDGSGAYDAMPTSSTGVESNPATPWNAYTNLDRYYEVVVDGNGDGTPDTGFPPGGSISGTVTLDDPGDTQTVVTVAALQGGEVVKSVTTPAGGGAYTIPLLTDGTYDVRATAVSYLAQTEQGIVISGENDVTGIDFLLERVNGKIEGDVALTGGPAVDVTVTAYDANGAIAGDGPQTVTGGAGHFEIVTVIDGTWTVEATALGYAEQKVVAVVANEDTVDVGALTLPAVVATRYAFTDDGGDALLGTSTTVSSPDEGLFYFARAWIEPQDEGGRIAVWDAASQESVRLAATALDPAYATLGDIVFADADSVPLAQPVITADMFDAGRAPVLVAGDAIEVVRVRAFSDTLEGVLEVGIGPAAPAKLALSADATTIEAGAGSARITGQLEDASGNPARVAGVRADMSATGAGGSFSVTAPETDANGWFEVDFTGTTAGTASVTAVVDPASGLAGLPVDTLSIVVEPGPAASVSLSSSPASLRAGGTAVVSARVEDEWGNTVALQGISITLSATPAALVASLDSPIVTDATGVATGELTAASAYGLIELSAGAGSLETEPIYVTVDATIVAVDESAPESDAAHNSDPGIDLTVLKAVARNDTLAVTLDFSSVWDGAHLGLLVETADDAAGGANDPFEFPVVYGHALKPDYAFTYKYAAQDYGDLRRFRDGQWWHYDFANHEWRIGWAEGVNAVQQGFVGRVGGEVTFLLPLAVISPDAGPLAPGDTVRLEAYVMQETEGQKRTALDSTPHDATHDMLPAAGNWWETATTPVTLTQYAEHVLAAPGSAPTLSAGAATPSVAQPGETVVYTVVVTDAGGGVGDVLLDLSEIGGSPYARMRDDGNGADAAAGDGTYSVSDVLSDAASDGDHTVTVTASDAANVWSSRLGVTLTVDNPATALRSFDDPVGDDHGPSKTSDGTPTGTPVAGLYYTYPTNRVFLPGSFDITKFEVFRDGDWLVFRTSVQDLANHQDPGAADWGAPQPSEQTCDDPDRTDLNLQKIDIYIDAREGEGATSGFPNRYVDLASVDAWDYGIAVEGWGKWFVVSNDENSQSSWTQRKSDSDIRMCNSHSENWIDVRVRAGLFDADDLAAIAEWDIVVCLSSHDGNTDDTNLGGIRWVNQNTAEWQFGGGRDSESGRDRDANVIDVATSPGASHEPGRTQQEMLDYTTEEAEARFAGDKVAVVLEASFAEDFSPPSIAPLPDDPDVEHVPWVALNGAPAVIWTEMADFSGIGAARLYWRSLGDTTQHEVEMVNLAEDLWAADIPRDEVVAATNVVRLNKTGDARVLIARLYARDASSNLNEIWSGPYTVAIPEPWAQSQTIADIDTLLVPGEDFVAMFQDGTLFALEPVQDVPAGGIDVVLEPVDEGLIDIENIRGDMAFAGVARRIWLQTGAGDPMPPPAPAWVILHYPQYAVESLDEASLGLFTWVDATERWVFTGGAVNPDGNTVAAVGLEELGLFGVFEWDGLDVGDSRGLAGVLAEPNPFSPNDDGLYDETTVSFFLGRAADHVNIEFYDLAGRLARRLVFHAPANFTGRLPVRLVWDGKDEDGHAVPYGLYVMRVEAKFKTAPTFERVNAAVAVLK